MTSVDIHSTDPAAQVGLPAGQQSDSANDEVLMLAYGKGDMAAFETLYKRHKDPLLRFFCRQTQSQSLAEELFQDVWAKVIGQRTTYKPDAKFTTWLYTVARHRLIDHYRRQGAAPDWLEQEEEHPAPVNTQAEHRLTLVQKHQWLKQQVELLPAAQREAFVLKYDAGFNEQDIAAITGVEQQAIKSRIRYAINKLKASVWGGEDE